MRHATEILEREIFHFAVLTLNKRKMTLFILFYTLDII